MTHGMRGRGFSPRRGGGGGRGEGMDCDPWDGEWRRLGGEEWGRDPWGEWRFGYGGEGSE